MNHFYNTFRKTHDWGCFVYQNDGANEVDFMAEVEKDKKDQSEFQPLSDERKEEMDKDQEGRNYQQAINEMIEHIESGETKESPKGFGAIPASEFLNRTTEDLNTLFVEKEGAIDFHGNEGARRYVGMGDLFSSKQQFIKMNDIVGKRSIANGKVGYVDKSGNYLAIFGGETMDLTVSEEEQGGFENIQEYSEEEEEDAKEEFRKKVEANEKALEEMREAMRELLKDQGLSDEVIDNMNPKEMFRRVGKFMAQQVEEKYGIPWKVCFAQAALESGYGEKALGNNFFGVKAMKGYLGKSQEFMTTEYWGDKSKASKMVDKFRAYDSIADSFNDYGQLLSNTSRYAGAFQYKNNPRKFLETVIASGYATDPQYVNKAENTLRQLGYSLDDRNDMLSS